jgi:hypothetical protein
MKSFGPNESQSRNFSRPSTPNIIHINGTLREINNADDCSQQLSIMLLILCMAPEAVIESFSAHVSFFFAFLYDYFFLNKRSRLRTELNLTCTIVNIMQF